DRADRALGIRRCPGVVAAPRRRAARTRAGSRLSPAAKLRGPGQWMAAATGRGWRRPRAGCTASRAGAADGEAPRARRKQEARAPCPEGTHRPGPKWQEASAAGPRSGEGVIFSKKGVVKDTGGT